MHCTERPLHNARSIGDPPDLDVSLNAPPLSAPATEHTCICFSHAAAGCWLLPILLWTTTTTLDWRERQMTERKAAAEERWRSETRPAGATAFPATNQHKQTTLSTVCMARRGTTTTPVTSCLQPTTLSSLKLPTAASYPSTPQAPTSQGCICMPTTWHERGGHVTRTLQSGIDTSAGGTRGPGAQA